MQTPEDTFEIEQRTSEYVDKTGWNNNSNKKGNQPRGVVSKPISSHVASSAVAVPHMEQIDLPPITPDEQYEVDTFEIEQRTSEYVDKTGWNNNSNKKGNQPRGVVTKPISSHVASSAAAVPHMEQIDLPPITPDEQYEVDTFEIEQRTSQQVEYMATSSVTIEVKHGIRENEASDTVTQDSYQTAPNNVSV
jgi:hypothetical protein